MVMGEDEDHDPYFILIVEDPELSNAVILVE